MDKKISREDIALESIGNLVESLRTGYKSFSVLYNEAQGAVKGTSRDFVMGAELILRDALELSKEYKSPQQTLQQYDRLFNFWSRFESRYNPIPKRPVQLIF